MSTRELAYNIIDQMSDEQIEGLVMLLKGYFPQKNIPNNETLEAFDELDNNGGFVFSGTTEQLFNELAEE